MDDVTFFEVCACNKNVNRMLTEEEIEEAMTVRTDTEPISYMKPLVPKFENASTWSDMAVAHLWMLY